MEEYIGKILGNQGPCCEENREVTSSSFTDESIYLNVQCTVCGKKWVEVLD